MLAQILYRQAGSPVVKDADETLWYGKALKWAQDNGVSDGLNMTENVTREQLVTVLNRYVQLLKLGLGRTAEYSTYKDAAKVDAWAVDAMETGSPITTSSSWKRSFRISMVIRLRSFAPIAA